MTWLEARGRFIAAGQDAYISLNKYHTMRNGSVMMHKWCREQQSYRYLLMTLRAYVNALLLVRSIACGADTTSAWLDRRLVCAAPVRPLEKTVNLVRF